MNTGEAVGAMIPMTAPRSGRHHRPAANLAGKGIGAWMSAVIPLVVLSLFIFTVHFYLLLSFPDRLGRPSFESNPPTAQWERAA